MTRAVNDATLQKAGDIYQYLIALRDCFELNDGDTLQIETNGDVSIINDVGGRFQREVKHHFGNTSISDRDIDFWKTLANWYVDYERVKNFSNYILSTTATIKSDSPFHSWNNIKKTEKLKCLKDIGATSKKTEETFRNQYNRIFGDSYDESRLLEILDKFTIEAAKTSIDGISNEFSKYVGHIPSENRDGYIGALLGEILIKVKEPPHKWEVTKSAFDEILQIQSAAYGTKGTAPLPNEYAKAVVPKDKITTLEQKKFVASIREIKYDKMNPHFYSLLMQSFLSGYEKPCEIKLPFMAIPILLYAESREKLVNANRRSRIDTLFQSPQIIDERKISGKTRLSGYVDRYNSLKPYCKEAIIILFSEGKIAFNNHKIVLIKKIDYKDFEGAIKDWIKCAFYLGVVFSKTTEDHLSFFLGVDTK